MYRNRGDKWLSYYSWDFKNYPNDEILKSTNTVIIPGSAASAYSEDILWVPEMGEFI